MGKASRKRMTGLSESGRIKKSERKKREEAKRRKEEYEKAMRMFLEMLAR